MARKMIAESIVEEPKQPCYKTYLSKPSRVEARKLKGYEVVDDKKYPGLVVMRKKEV